MSVRFGVSLFPGIGGPESHLELAQAAEVGGLDLVGIQDHPYAPRQLDALSLIAVLLASTERLRFFPDVACLPLRPPAVLAQAMASLDILSAGRVELGIGAGGYWNAIATYGVDPLGHRQALAGLEEAITLIRSIWTPGPRLSLEGSQYGLAGAEPGPEPAHGIGIWVGAQSPRALRVTGRIGDGWAAPIPSYLPYEQWGNAQQAIDVSARAAGRDPGQITRIAQLVGTITDAPGPDWRAVGDDPIRATAGQWAVVLARLARELRFDTFVFWPERGATKQVSRFAGQVVPRTRELLGELT